MMRIWLVEWLERMKEGREMLYYTGFERFWSAGTLVLCFG